MTRRARGFTLVETLVALTLLALIATMLFGGLRFGARSWDAVASRSAERDAVVAAQSFLRGRLAEVARPGDGRTPVGSNAFEGGSRSMSFTAPWSAGPVRPGVYRFKIWLEGGRLTLAWRPEKASVAGPSGERALLDGVGDLTIDYFGAARDVPGTAAAWRSVWAESEDAPRLIRLRLVFDDPTRIWPDLVVRRGL